MAFFSRSMNTLRAARSRWMMLFSEMKRIASQHCSANRMNSLVKLILASMEAD